MKMKLTTKLLGILIASIALVACGGGGSDPVVKTEKVWRLKEKVTGNTKVTFDYDGSGNLIRQNHGGLEANSLREYFEFDYDDEGVLLTKKIYSVSTGKLTRLVEFDDRGQAVLNTRGDTNGKPIKPADHVYIVTYNEGDRDSAKEKMLVQHKILQSSSIYSSEVYQVYPEDEIFSRDVSGTANGILFYTIEANKVTATWHDKPDDGSADYVTVFAYTDQGDIESTKWNSDGNVDGPFRVRRQNEYTYDNDVNGNLEKSVMTNLINGSVTTTHYTWEQMDIPVQ